MDGTPGRLVRRLREAAGLTQRQLAIRAGTTKTAISRLEADHLSPTVDTLDRLLVCLGYRLTVDAVPMTPRSEHTQLDAVADLTPAERLDHALASQTSLRGILGDTRG